MAWESPWQSFEGLDLGSLETDQAYLRVNWAGQGPAYLYWLSDNCHGCPWQLLRRVDETAFTFHTHHSTRWLLRRDSEVNYITLEDAAQDDRVICDVTAHLGEFGVYDFNASDEQCEVVEALAPVNANLALLVCFLVYLAGGLLWWGINRFAGDQVSKLAIFLGWNKEEEQKTTSRPRVRSLDTFRGIAIVLMIFVNDGGGGYWFMEHATWNGLYVADLVFPWFLWIMGVCIPMSVKSCIKKETPVKTVVWQVTVRSVKLFILGFILNTLGGWITLSKLRVPGVLQRFGICYFVVFIIGYTFTRSETRQSAGLWWAKIADIVNLLPQWVVMLCILATHQLVTYLVAAPGCDAGYTGPGGLHNWTPKKDNMGCIGGITGYIDKAFFTTPHIYGNPTAKGVYSASAFDPEGIFGCLTSIFQVFLGYQAGYTMQLYSGTVDRIGRWVGWSVLTGAIGALLCGASQNDGWVPVNKNLWSISFVMVTSSFAFLLLAVLYFLIDHKHLWKGQPFFYAGMNSILLYCGHQVGYNLFPFHFMIGDMRTHAAKLPESLWGPTLWLVIAFILYRKKVFVTV